MSHQRTYGRRARAVVTAPLAVGWALTVASMLLPPDSHAQDAAPAPGLAVEPPAAGRPIQRPAPVSSQPGLATTASAPPGGTLVSIDGEVTDASSSPAPSLPADVQVVRFQGPAGTSVEVLAPQPTPVPTNETGGILTVGLKRGVGYRLRIANIPERPGVELFPVIEVVGHLHRPDGIDPGKYPIRVILTLDDLDPAINQSRMVTKVIYLEDPEQALPIRMAKDQIPVVTLNPTEHPLRVASALGRPVAIVRIGGRRPTVEELNAGATGDFGLDYAAAVGRGPCPFATSAGDPCKMPCGPPSSSPPPPRPPLASR